MTDDDETWVPEIDWDRWELAVEELSDQFDGLLANDFSNPYVVTTEPLDEEQQLERAREGLLAALNALGIEVPDALA